MSSTYTLPTNAANLYIQNSLQPMYSGSNQNYYIDLKNVLPYPVTVSNAVVTNQWADYDAAIPLTLTPLDANGTVCGFNISAGTNGVKYGLDISAYLSTNEIYAFRLQLPMGSPQVGEKIILTGDVYGVGSGFVINTTILPSAISTIANTVNTNYPPSIQAVTFTLSSNDLTNNIANGIMVLPGFSDPDGQTNLMYMIHAVNYWYQYGTTQYNSGNQLQLGYFGYVNVNGTYGWYPLCQADTGNNNQWEQTYSCAYQSANFTTFGGNNPTNGADGWGSGDFANLPIYVYSQSNLSGGDGSFRITVFYSLLNTSEIPN